MTARDLELQKLTRLIELAEIKEAEQKRMVVFSVVKSANSKAMEFNMEGTLLEIISTAMTGLSHLEDTRPEAKELIEVAFAEYLYFRNKGNSL